MGKFIEQLGGLNNLQKFSVLGIKLEFVEKVASIILDNNIQGSIAEAGVYKGGCSKLLSTMFPSRSIHLFDTFSGFIENDYDKDGYHKAGDFSDTDIESVKRFLAKNSNCVFHQGWFPHSTVTVNDDKFALVHADMDYLQSTQAIIEFFWPKITVGGAIIFDDYGWKHCPGVVKAVNNYYTDRKDFLPLGNLTLNTIAYFKILN